MGDTIRFGISRGDRRAGTFVVASSATTPDIYILSRAVGRQSRISLHQSDSFRYTVEPISAETGEVMPPVGGDTWRRPEPFAPGLTKMFSVILPAAGVTLPMGEDDDGVYYVPVPRGAWGVEFTLILSAPGMPVRSWPGADAMGTTLIGKTGLSTGETLWVVAHVVEDSPMPDGEAQTGQLLPGQTMDELREALASGTLRTIAYVVGEEGSRAWVESAVMPKEDVPQSTNERGQRAWLKGSARL